MEIYCKFTAESVYKKSFKISHVLSVSGHCPAETWRTHQMSWVWQETAVVNCCYIDFDL